MRQRPLAIAGTLLVGLYDMALFLYPSHFRREYAPHMQQVFRDVVRDTVQAGHWMGFLHIGAETMFDLMRSLPYEHYTALMEMSPRRLTALSSFGAFYLAAMPLGLLGASYLGAMQYQPIILLFALPALWGVPVMVLGISGRLLPGQRYTSVPYLMVSGGVIAYITLLIVQQVLGIEALLAWGVTGTALNRMFWMGIAILGVMAFAQREKRLGFALCTMASVYFALSFSGGFASGLVTSFALCLIGVFMYVGIWLQKRKDVSIQGNYAISWWAVALQSLIVIGSVAAIGTSVYHPARHTEVYKKTAGVPPSGDAVMYFKDNARDAIEDFIGKPLPESAYDISMSYDKDGQRGLRVRIGFSAAPEEVRQFIDAGVLCFQVDVDDIPVNEDRPMIEQVPQAEWYTQRPNPWNSAEPWWWIRNESHIKGYCPLPRHYMLEIYMASPDSWWVRIWG